MQGTFSLDFLNPDTVNLWGWMSLCSGGCLCTERWSAPSLVSTHWPPPTGASLPPPPSPDNQECLQPLPSVPGRGGGQNRWARRPPAKLRRKETKAGFDRLWIQSSLPPTPNKDCLLPDNFACLPCGETYKLSEEQY